MKKNYSKNVSLVRVYTTLYRHRWLKEHPFSYSNLFGIAVSSVILQRNDKQRKKQHVLSLNVSCTWEECPFKTWQKKKI